MAEKYINTKIKLRADTTANWSSANPVLLYGEIGLDTTLNKFKIGDGSTAFNSLPWASSYADATTATSGLMSAQDKTKLEGIEAGAEVNPAAYLKTASISNNQLTLTKQDDTTVSFSGGVTSVDGRSGAVTVVQSGTGQMPENVSIFIDENGGDLDLATYRTAASQDVIDAGKINEPTNEGTNGQVLTTDGNGGRTWTTIQSGDFFTVVNNKVCAVYEEGDD